MTKRIKSSAEIYSVVEEAMTGLDKPITCAELMEVPEVRASAVEKFGSDIQIATNKLSDLLGFMWRRGVIQRYAADSSSTMARFAYLWKHVEVPLPKVIPSPTPPEMNHALTITEKDGEVILDFKQFTICIKPK